MEGMLSSKTFYLFLVLFAARLEEKPCSLLKLGLDILFSGIYLFAFTIKAHGSCFAGSLTG
ncbi:hypothetical protein [Wolbachia endosymbiont of Mansonella perstans]|uniref:hypothetical protein n=1 Tax=Wolbachia endosymbiont of Mansonella perstans TaxID=229526 RepID=UPI001CE0D51F|nr:hypothetical protein [Wolbachia endosymbiont of Mansonella perstans]MCA4773871.1 hypothetical protein [Wolbachia endosymbiont of Mansonella perstans]